MFFKKLFSKKRIRNGVKYSPPYYCRYQKCPTSLHPLPSAPLYIYSIIDTARHLAEQKTLHTLQQTHQRKTERIPSSMVEEESSSMMPKLITFLSSVLQRVAESNDDLVDDDSAIETQKNSAFHGLTRPSISLHTYLERIFKYANCSNSCFIVAYVYLDRFAQRQPLLPINSFNVHRLLITSVLVAAKFMDDL